MGEARGGQWDREGLGNVPAVGDGGDKLLNCPVGSSVNSLEEVMLLTPPSETFLCPSRKLWGENFRILVKI